MNFLKKIKSALGLEVNESEDLYRKVVESAYLELQKNNERYWWNIKVADLTIYNDFAHTLSDKQKVSFILEAIAAIDNTSKTKSSFSTDDKDYRLRQIADNFIQQFLKTKLVLDEADIIALMDAFSANQKYNHGNLLQWPILLFINQVKKNVEQMEITPSLKTSLVDFRKKVEDSSDYYHQKDKSKLLNRLDEILFNKEGDPQKVKPTYFPGEDEFAQYANETVRTTKEDEQQVWFALLQHAQKASGAKPTAKYLTEAKNLFKNLPGDRFKLQVNNWIDFLVKMKEKSTEHTSQYGNQTHTYTTTEFLHTTNMDMIKGLIWNCTHFHDKTTLFNLARLAERAYRKIPGKGPAAASVANACLYVLANSKGMDGLGHLSRLKLRIKQSSTQNLIEKYLQDAAVKQGVTIHEIEDMAVDDFGLDAGKRTFTFEDYTAVVEIIGVGKSSLSWFKPDGNEQKTMPAFVKEKLEPKLKKLKDSVKQIELTTSAQRDRLGRMLISNRPISGDKFESFYFNHGLMRFLVKKIIWTYTEGSKQQDVFFLQDHWVNAEGATVQVQMTANESFTLWHPVFHSIETVQQWRSFMMQYHIVQPLKQAFREVYFLTDAEVNTRVYSNRMAAHILKQHQFNMLAKTRGWKYSLMGAYDNGIEHDKASIDLKEYQLRAEFWISEVNADDAFNDTGIWNFVATDQIRFIDTASNQPKELFEIPAIVFSEVFRDVDLFVGVASVGNDPNWRDNGGLPQYHDYWQSYSFGDLTEIAKTRKGILEGLLPRLKIAKVARVQDKFLVVKGKFRTYKIHIGSTNILMEPNDQYLCIVPDRSQKDVTGNVFLPFEGDNGLSVILSKAMLLAEDDQITDSTILTQIHRK